MIDNYRIIAILLILVAIVIYFRSSCKTDSDATDIVEGMTATVISNEGLRNIAAVYNNKDIYVQNLNVNGTFSHVPKGTIVIWMGKSTNIPKGWVICDGKNGTPNMMNRYPIGSSSAGAAQGKSINASGQSSAAGNHAHSVGTSKNSPLYTVALCCKPTSSARTSAGTSIAGNHAHTVTINKLSNLQLNRFTAVFIMKT